MSVAVTAPQKATGYAYGQYSRKGHTTLDDGSLVLSPEDLAVFGGGDAKRGAKEIRRMITMERDRPEVEGKTERPASVRFATPEDEDAIFNLLIEDVQENASVVALPSPAKIRAHIRTATQRTNSRGELTGCTAGVIDGAERKPVAVCMLVPTTWWWSDSWYYAEMPLYVHRDHRRSNHFRDLLHFMEWWVQQMTVNSGIQVHLLCGVMGTRGVREKAMAYRRRYRLAGCAYIYPAPPFRSEA